MAQPPSVLLSVSHYARTYEHLMTAREVGVHLLAADQTDIAAILASKADDKFDRVQWVWDRNVPKIVGARAFLLCTPRARFEPGDHAILICSVLDGNCDNDAEPLIYHQREFTSPATLSRRRQR